MHITIITMGSRGDVQPYLAFAVGLKNAGHQVRLATHAKFEQEIRAYGLEFALIKGNPQEALASEAGQALMQTKNPLSFPRQLAALYEPILKTACEDSWEAVPMTGGSPNHNKITGNFYAALNFALKRQPYSVFITDQKLWIPKKKINTYPDVMIVAGELEFKEGRRDTITNPLMIGKVLSKSTRNYDKDGKFLAYRTIPTFREYLLIDQYTMHVEQYSKTDNNRWIFTEYEDAEQIISLESINFQISLADIYDKVNFEEQE